MRALYIDCRMGAAGDMLMAALLDLIDEKYSFLEELNHLGIPNVHIWNESVEKCGIKGTQVHVEVHDAEKLARNSDDRHHYHRTLGDIYNMIDGLNVSEQVRYDAKAVYEIIASAESFVHACSTEHVHFHEVGMLDAVADVVGCCMLMEKLDLNKIVVSPIHVGSGTVKCAHGILPVPAPATAKILEGLPTYGGSVEGELCTPTGAALLKYFAQSFGPMPDMHIEKRGRGIGTKEFPGHTNGLCVLFGKIE